MTYRGRLRVRHVSKTVTLFALFILLCIVMAKYFGVPLACFPLAFPWRVFLWRSLGVFSSTEHKTGLEFFL